MLAAFAADAAVELEEEGPIAHIDTWYLRGHRPFVTEHTRTLRIDQHYQDWHSQICELWRDTIDPQLPLAMQWVTPGPPNLPWHEKLGHLLLTQDVADQLVPVLFSLRFLGQARDALGFAAALLVNPVQFGPTKDLLRLARLCLSRHCRLSFRNRIWQLDETIPLAPGSGLEFTAGRLADRVGDDDIVDPIAPTIDTAPDQPLLPVQPPLAAEPPFIRDLHKIWLDQSTDGPGGIEQILRVQTWYLEGSYIRHNDECRMVVLGEEYWEWERALQRRWIDLLYPDGEVDYVFVTPAPPTAATPTEIHIILYQRVRAFECPSIVTTYDNGILQGRPYTAAILLPAAVTLEEIIRRTGKSFFCPPHLPTATCTCFHEGFELQPLQKFPNRNGYAFILMVHRQLPSNFWDDNFDGLGDSTAASSFLQIQAHLKVHQTGKEERLTTGSVAHDQWPPAQAPCVDEQGQKIDLHDSIRAFEAFDAHFFLADFTVPSIGMWHLAYPWLHDWWDFSTPGNCIWIYYDGSYHTQQEHGSASAAAAAFLEVNNHWFFAGAISTQCPFAQDSYSSEHFASAIGLKLAYDILKIHEAISSSLPAVHFCFDLLTVRHQTSGLWHCFKHPILGHELRNIHRLIEARFGVEIYHWHVRGHVGHPGNELVDSLANAAQHTEPTPDAEWLRSLCTQAFRTASDWFWILFDSHYGRHWAGHCLNFPMPKSHPTGSEFPLQSSSEHNVMANRLVQVQSRLASCNVLSICGQRSERECGLSGPPCTSTDDFSAGHSGKDHNLCVSGDSSLKAASTVLR